MCNIFEDSADACFTWNLLFTDVSNDHAPFKEVKVRSSTKDVSPLMNLKYKALRKANKHNDPPNLSERYKMLINQVCTRLKEPKASYNSS